MSNEKIDHGAENLSLDVSQDVKQLVREIIDKYNISSTLKVTYSSGSEAGDNYASKIVVVDIKDDKELLSLFIKYAHSVDSDGLSLHNFYSNEICFYDVIYTTLSNFAEERGVKNAFTNVPKCYGTSEKYVIALDNVKNIGYQLFDRQKKMDENHIAIVFKAFAKYHALCFALKDQERGRFEEIANKIHNYFYQVARDASNDIKNLYAVTIDAFLSQLDPVEDKLILDKCQNLWEEYIQLIIEGHNKYNRNFIITKGDCWSNNTMFRYEAHDEANLVDVMLVDWQLLGLGPVVADLSYFFYSAAYDEHLDKLEYYLKIYHNELSKSIEKLSSNPEVVYPYSMFEEEWKRYSRIGYMAALLVMKIVLVDKEEALDFSQGEEVKDMLGKFGEMKVTGEYMRRMKMLTQHFIRNDFL